MSFINWALSFFGLTIVSKKEMEILEHDRESLQLLAERAMDNAKSLDLELQQVRKLQEEDFLLLRKQGRVLSEQDEVLHELNKIVKDLEFRLYKADKEHGWTKELMSRSLLGSDN